MKSFLTAIITLLISTQLQALQVAYSPLVFQGRGSPYVELNYQVIGNTISFDTLDNNNLQAAVEVMLIFKKDSAIVSFDKFRLRSPLVKSPQDFIDIKRYPLPAGTYVLVMEFRDVNDSTNRAVYDDVIDIPDYGRETTGFSSIKLLASLKTATENDMEWVEHGLVMEPLPHNYYDRRHDQLSFFAEFYGLPEIEARPLVLQMDIRNKENGQWESLQKTYHKLKSYNSVEAFARKINIEKLPSDLYMLHLSLIDGNKDVYAQTEVLFSRSNPDKDLSRKQELLADKNANFFNEMSNEKLEYAIRAIAPRAAATDQERINYLIANGTPQMRRDFLFGYWLDQNPTKPEQAYLQYMQLIDALDEKFYSAFGHGFETDRGRIYLKYGPPTQIVNRQNDHSAKPYEIWTYDRIDLYNQNDVKFVFYNPTLGGNDYELLHSNARNEIQNPKWLQYIYNVPDEFEGNPVDGTGVQDNYGREASRLFNDN